MENKIKALAVARREEKEKKGAREEALKAADATPAGKHLAACVVAAYDAKQAVAWLETMVREDALATFGTSGDTDPHPAVKVKRHTVYDYDPAAALEYARQFLPSTVKLDARKFKKACGAIDIPGVTSRIEPRATIKRDLSQWDDPDG